MSYSSNACVRTYASEILFACTHMSIPISASVGWVVGTKRAHYWAKLSPVYMYSKSIRAVGGYGACLFAEKAVGVC
jgi:hypothetical protein